MLRRKEEVIPVRPAPSLPAAVLTPAGGKPDISDVLPRWAQSLILYVAAAMISITVLFFALHLWKADLRVPFGYTHEDDTYLFMALTKTVGETGWYMRNPRLGAPGQMQLYDYPLAEALHWGMIRFLFFFTSNYAIVFNLYFLLAFVLIGLTTLYAARALGLHPATSLLVSQLYAFLPYHFMRGQCHLALGAYYVIPLSIPAIFRISRGIRIFGSETRISVRPINGFAIGALVAFALGGLANPYHAAFTIFFLVMACLVTAMRFGRAGLPSLADAGILLGVLLLMFFLQMMPSLIYRIEHGPNPLAMLRMASDGDVYGLKLSQMLLPAPNHRLARLAALRESYAESVAMVNENESAALGTLGSVGFLFLLGRLFFRLARRSAESECDPRVRLLDDLALLAMAGFLFGTVGGFGSTYFFLFSRILRALNRISIFINLFALIAAGILVERACEKWRPQKPHTAELFASIVLLIFGLIDQTSPHYIPQYQNNARQFANDERFVASVEAALPTGAAVFQLPVVQFVGSPSVNNLADSQLFRGYLHSSHLRWSYGAMKGREDDAWQQKVSQLPLTDAIDSIRRHGFAGIYLDSRGFPNMLIENAIADQLGPRIVSDDGQLVFFKL